jgi:hypothetical protein
VLSDSLSWPSRSLRSTSMTSGTQLGACHCVLEKEDGRKSGMSSALGESLSGGRVAKT